MKDERSDRYKINGCFNLSSRCSCLYRFTIRRLAPLYTRQQDGEFCSNKGDQSNSVKYQESKCGETSVTDIFKPTDRDKIVAMQSNDG